MDGTKNQNGTFLNQESFVENNNNNSVDPKNETITSNQEFVDVGAQNVAQQKILDSNPHQSQTETHSFPSHNIDRVLR